MQFHLRAYCVAFGRLTVYLNPRILALFSSAPYDSPHVSSEDETMDLSPHLTNTCLQTDHSEDNVRLLDELVGCQMLSLPEQTCFSAHHVTSLTEQVTKILADTFEAAMQNPVHFQVSV